MKTLVGELLEGDHEAFERRLNNYGAEMTRTELRELLRNGESSGVELKRDLVEPEGLAKELVAFANFDGGSVLVGVDDDGTPTGLTRANLEEWVMQVCRDKIRPELIPFFEVVRDVEPGKDVAVVRVLPGYAVHHRWHNNHRTYYVRVGSTSREASPEELERLFQRRGNLRPELRPVSGTDPTTLDSRRLRDYFTRVRGQEAPEVQDLAGWTSLLLNTELMVEVDGAPPACSVAGVLLFGRSPNRWLPQAGLDAVAYPGSEKDYNATLREALRGPLTGLYQRDEAGRSQLLEAGLVEQALAFLTRALPRPAGVTAGGVREEGPELPLEVLREAVVNALVHRDYLLTGSTVELSVYADRLEIVSPGRLPNGITPARMKTGCRAARNQLLKDAMRDYGYLEHMGMGVPRKIVRGMREFNGTEPELIEQEESFVVRLSRAARGGANKPGPA